MFRYLFPFLLIMLLGACARQPVVPEDSRQLAWEQHRSLVMNLKDWKIQGRVGLYTADEAWPGDLHWQQSDAQYDMRIIAPMGAGNLHVYSVEGGVMLEHSSNTQAHFTPDPEALIQQQFGWMLPMKNLRYWITGIPSPLVNIQGKLDLDAQGRLNSLKQSGWNISFLRYQELKGLALPQKVLLEHEDLSLKIVIRKWQI